MSQEQANIVTLLGREAKREGYTLSDASGYIATLTEWEVGFIVDHRCTSDCGREGCEEMYSRQYRIELLT